jgi:hypothetical protein
MIGHSDPMADRVLVAAQLRNDGFTDAAHKVLNTVTAFHATTVDPMFNRICDLLAELDHQALALQLCTDDFRSYVDTYTDEQARSDWPGWRESEIDRLTIEVEQITVDALGTAESIAALADRSVAA